ncbi:CCR4-NOT transcription complex [Diaporthe helianthi]|uniref:General negative regulator of transcription subunit n=1 Tax=Diaporthe helianthi TaxID=158607 RepID=A0A2P5I0E9_DIAHE|nr:CCR4-NOT transcription complex [Diaporthe helianthi]
MAARKLAQEVEKTFKKVGEGIEEFDEIYEKIEQSNNPAQKEKLEDSLKREIKKLQRLRDQIKTWAASNDIKDKGPLIEQRKLIETRMEKFKAVEKTMKTKAFSKEGLSAAAKLDPKEKAKLEASDFLGSQIDVLEEQIEKMEADVEQLQVGMKKGKKAKKDDAEAIANIETVIEKHKWHQGKLELIRRSLMNGGVEADQVFDLKDSIRYYVEEGTSQEYMDDEEMYDDLNLEEEEDVFGMNLENDKISSQDTQSVADDVTETEGRSSSAAAKGKERPSADAGAPAGRKPSSQLKSPLPTLATLSTPSLPTSGGPIPGNNGMKPASVPTRPPGEGLKYASAAAAAADKNNVGIAPLPPPPSAHPAVGISSLANQSKTSSTSSPSISSAQIAAPQPQQLEAKHPPAAPVAPARAPTPATSTPKPEATKPAPARATGKPSAAAEPAEASKVPHTNGLTNGVKSAEPEPEEESIYHLPSSLDDLVESWEATKSNPIAPATSPAAQRLLAASSKMAPDVADAEPPRIYYPESYWNTNKTWPKEPLQIMDNPQLYQPTKVDNDTLFYAFYYKQGTYQQYLAAKALKDQAWRFHKQYQTWFQRHEEPKNITEEFEQGTYRFFDYESTWMNRRKADFKFAYKFLEDEV